METRSTAASVPFSFIELYKATASRKTLIKWQEMIKHIENEKTENFTLSSDSRKNSIDSKI